MDGRSCSDRPWRWRCDFSSMMVTYVHLRGSDPLPVVLRPPLATAVPFLLDDGGMCSSERFGSVAGGVDYFWRQPYHIKSWFLADSGHQKHTRTDLYNIRSICQWSVALLDKGAKYIVVEGLPTTGCLTLCMSLSPESDRDDMGCVASVNKQSYDHNTILQTKIRDLRQKYPQTVIIYADYWNAYRAVVKNAPKLGFKELYKVCCGSNGAPYNFDILATCGSESASACPNPSQYINWDGVHLTEAMYKVVADSFLKGGFTHPPFGSLVSSKEYSG